MKIEIKNRFNDKIIITGEYDNIKDALLKNSEADLSEADLYRANLYGANLSGADLYRANLSEADLYRADLSGANLSGADLYGADLSGANLSGADLSRADGIKLPIFNITGTLHPLLYMNGNIRIGCENHSLTEWVENYKTIGKENGYSEDQICEYGGYITTIATLIKSKEQVYEK